MSAYFWDEATKSVKHIDDEIYAELAREQELQFMYCVDLAFPQSDPARRYGEFRKNGWTVIPLQEFPAEFRAHLLLLGVA